VHFNLSELMEYDLRLHGKKIIFSEFTIATGVGAILTGAYLFNPGIAATYRLFAIFLVRVLS
jgi:hypothetical protein